MSKINDKFLEISSKISEEEVKRTIDNNKNSLDTVTEAFIRSKNDEALLNKINNVSDVANEKINDLYSKLNNINEFINSQKVETNEVIDFNYEKLDELAINVDKLSELITKNVEEINNKIIEKSKTTNKQEISIIDQQLYELTVENENLRKEYEDTAVIKHLTENIISQLKIANKFVKITDDNNKLKNLLGDFDREAEKFFNLNSNVSKVILDSKDTLIKINKQTIFSEKITLLEENLNINETLVDLQLLTAKKLILEKTRIETGFKELLTEYFENEESVISYTELLYKNLNNLERIYKDLVNNKNNQDKTKNDIVIIYTNLSAIYNDTLLENNQTTHNLEVETLKTQVIELKNLVDKLNSSINKNNQSTVQEPTVQEPTAQEPTAQEPTAQEPTAQEPTVQEPTVQEPTNVSDTSELFKLPLLMIKKNLVRNGIETDSISTEIMDDSTIREYVINESNKIELPSGVTVNVSISNINLEESKVNDNKIEKLVIGKLANLKFKYNDIRIIGQGVKTQYQFTNKLLNSNTSFVAMKLQSESISVMSKSQALKLAGLIYGEKYINGLSLELVYYSSLESDIIVPAYQVSGVFENNQLINTVIPANLDYFPKTTLNNVSILSNSLEEKNVELTNNDLDSLTNTMYNNKSNFSKFTIELGDLKSSDKVELVSKYNLVNNLEKDNTFYIYVPIKLNQRQFNKLNQVKVFLTSTNVYGFTNQNVLVIDLSKYSNLFEIINESEPNPNHGGNLHNYGIEWGESELGGSIFNRYIEEMSKYNVHKEYCLDAEDSMEIHFKDYNNSGMDDYYVDNVDTSVYIGHGSGDGFTFETESSDSKLNYNDAALGDGWGNRDMEFKALLSCQVLKEESNGKTWAERWGPAFNGLHLLCGFQTDAHVGEHNLLKFFANNQYDKKQTVRMSWLNSVNCDQPEDVQAVVMGPLVSNSNTNTYNSIPSSISGLYRAYWNDHAWGVYNGPAIDVKRINIKGWWRIVVTV